MLSAVRALRRLSCGPSLGVRRLTQAPRDSNFAIEYVKREARLPQQQQAVLKALEFKCDVLWAQLDALYHAYVAPAHVPPGAFRPEEAS